MGLCRRRYVDVDIAPRVDNDGVSGAIAREQI
jgi:hypothetical protein